MVIKKTKESDFLSPDGSELRFEKRKALSKNNGESVKYRIRKQQEKEANDELSQDYFGEDDDVLSGPEAPVPGVD